MKKISVNELQIGDKVVKLDKGWFETGLLTHKFTVKDNAVIQKLKDNGVDHVFIERDELEAAVIDIFQGRPEEIIEHKKEIISRNYIDLDRVSSARTLYVESVKIVHSVLGDIRSGKMFNENAVKSVASNIAEITLKNRGVMASMSKLKHHDDYTFLHSMNVSIFASSLAAHLGMSQKEVERIAQAGLLHDVGKMLVPAEILNKPGKLSEEEFKTMKSHVILGYEYLVRQGLPKEMLNLALQHHERYDGSGYPQGLKDAQISVEGKIGAVVDIYDAITSDRCYHKGMEPPAALKLMFKWTDSHINKKIFEFFVMNVGIYPVGSLVLLDTNELAVVGRMNTVRPTEPAVLVFMDKAGRRVPVQMIDLAKNVLHKKKILGPVNPENINIPDEVYSFIEGMNEIK
ncbi:MAG: HD-GYP domain-containing protein [Deferribacterales bacterium]